MSTETVHATSDMRLAAARAIEYLVQHHGIDRADIFAEPNGSADTSGTTASGGDASIESGETSRTDAVLAGEIQMSVDVGSDETENLRQRFARLAPKQSLGGWSDQASASKQELSCL